MKNYKIGLQLYSVRNELAADFEGTLKKVKEIGYDYVEFAGVYGGKTGEELRAILDGNGLKCISVHQGIDIYKEQGSKFVDFLKTIGAQYAVIPWWSRDNIYGTENWPETEKQFRWLGKLLADGGLKFLYHNHDFEFLPVIDGKTAYDHMFEILDGVIYPEPDTCWINYAGYNPAEYLRKYKGKIDIVHLKDFRCKNLKAGPMYALIDKDGKDIGSSNKEENEFKYVPLGMGRQDFGEILKACEDINADCLIVEQDESVDRPPLEAAEISRKFLKDKFNI